MLVEQTMAKLRNLKLTGMAKAFEEQLVTTATHSLGFEERFGLIVDHEETYRENRRLKRLLKAARLKAPSACIEDIDFRHDRGLDRSQIASLAGCHWIGKGLNLILTGPTGSGKTWLACAFGNQAARHGKTVLFHRLPLLLEELQLAHGDGSFRRRLAYLAKVDLLILDDFGMGALNALARADMLEVIDSRVPGRSTIVTSQIAVADWHKYLGEGNPTVADAILDRVIGGSARINVGGVSMRMRQTEELDLA
jgi:DNA replication protein DnaC